jgi:hypothetical protein
MKGFLVVCEVWLTDIQRTLTLLHVHQTTLVNNKPSISTHVGLSCYRYRAGVTFALESTDIIDGSNDRGVSLLCSSRSIYNYVNRLYLTVGSTMNKDVLYPLVT